MKPPVLPLMRNRILLVSLPLLATGFSSAPLLAADAVLPSRPAPFIPAAPAPPRVSDVKPPPSPGAARGNRNKKLGEDMECLLEPHLVANVGSPVEGTVKEM